VLFRRHVIALRQHGGVFVCGVAMNKWMDGCVEAIGYAIIALAILSFILKNCDGW